MEAESAKGREVSARVQLLQNEVNVEGYYPRDFSVKALFFSTVQNLIPAGTSLYLKSVISNRLTLLAMGSVWTLARVWWVLTRHALVRLLNEIWCHFHYNWSLAERGAGGGFCDSAEGAHCTGVRHTCPRKAEPAGCRAVGHVVSKLGSQWWLCCYWSLFMLEVGRDMVPASSFVPKERSLCYLLSKNFRKSE